MNKLNILWTTTDKDTIFNMISMYASNSKRYNWWKEVNVIIWGASAKLVATDGMVQTEIKEMQNMGVNIEACKDCCDNLGATDKLLSIGIDVRYLGEPLTKYLKSDEKLITV
jgi:hypothetical protein